MWVFTEIWGLNKEDWEGEKVNFQMHISLLVLVLYPLVLLCSYCWYGSKQTLDVLFVTIKPTISNSQNFALDESLHWV